MYVPYVILHSNLSIRFISFAFVVFAFMLIVEIEILSKLSLDSFILTPVRYQKDLPIASKLKAQHHTRVSTQLNRCRQFSNCLLSFNKDKSKSLLVILLLIYYVSVVCFLCWTSGWWQVCYVCVCRWVASASAISASVPPAPATSVPRGPASVMPSSSACFSHTHVSLSISLLYLFLMKKKHCSYFFVSKKCRK